MWPRVTYLSWLPVHAWTHWAAPGSVLTQPRSTALHRWSLRLWGVTCTWRKENSSWAKLNFLMDLINSPATCSETSCARAGELSRIHNGVVGGRESRAWHVCPWTFHSYESISEQAPRFSPLNLVCKNNQVKYFSLWRICDANPPHSLGLCCCTDNLMSVPGWECFVLVAAVVGI